MDLIKRNNGEPFKTEAAAQARQTTMASNGVRTELVPLIEGGFALKKVTIEPKVKKERKKRVPLHSRSVLKAPDKPDVVRRFVIDKPGRLEAFEKAGYAYVTDGTEGADRDVGKSVGLGKKTSVVANTDGTVAYLMEQDSDDYADDQMAKEDRLKRMEKGMKPDKKEGQYGEGLRINHGE